MFNFGTSKRTSIIEPLEGSFEIRIQTAMSDLDALDTYLSSEDAHSESMGVSDLDGFLTGIACNPEPIPVKEWLDHAFGDANGAPDPITQIAHKMLQQIQSRLENGLSIEPVFWESPEGGVIAMDWCEGFMDAVKMRPDRWDAFVQTETGSKLMLPILVHMIDDDGNSAMGIPQEELDATLDMATEALAKIVPAVYQHIRTVTWN